VPLDRSLTVGRQAMPGQVVLDHPNVSRRHAAFEIVDGTIVLRDLGGTNGTYVNGERLRGARPLVNGDRIDIGPFQLTFDGTALTRVGRVGNVELLVRGVSYDVRRGQAGGAPRRILHGANLRIFPSEFVAIIGANGSGKSTLMNIIAGRVLPGEGTVLLNGGDLHANFRALKQDIAFVPQQDVLHEQLTLRQALDYTAQLRLPPDTTVEQRHAAVEKAARSVDCSIGSINALVALSGGQKSVPAWPARFSTAPVSLLDEVTSGLTRAPIGRSCACFDAWPMTSYHCCGHAPWRTSRSSVTKSSAWAAAASHLRWRTLRGAGVLRGARLGEVFDRTDERCRVLACQVRGNSWRHNQSANRRRVQDNARRPVCSTPRSGVHHTAACNAPAAILIHRNTTLLLSDRRTLVMAAAQSVLIGGLMGYAFGNFGTGQERVNAENALLLLLGLSAIWLGCNAASKDIVGELAIYRRENDVNLSTAAFIGAKYLVSCVFTVLQLAFVYVLVALLADGIPGDRLQQFMLLTVGAMAGTAMGLVISALANTRDQATTIVPLALVPQLILAGVLVPKLPDLATAVAKIAVSGYWLTEAMKSVFVAAEDRSG
jgi:ABC-type lipoprotein export system ATPase subunit